MNIRRRRLLSGKVSWQLDCGVVGGRRVQLSFKTEAAAIRERDRRLREQKLHGLAAGSLSALEMAEYRLAKAKLEAVGVELLTAVDFYLTHAAVVVESITVPVLVERFIESREAAQCSRRYVAQLRVSLGSLAKCCPLPVGAVRREEIKQWLASGGWAAKTRNNYLGDVRAMFGWAVVEHLAERSPCEGIAKVDLPEAEISSLTAAEAKILLEAAGAATDAELVWYLVLAMFCGVRPAEVRRMRREKVHLEERTVIVEGGTAKTGARRVVDLAPNAVAWLRAFPLAAEMICGRGFDDRWRCLRRRCGWATGRDEARTNVNGYKEARKIPITRGEWPADVLRHTFASMHYAEHQNEALLKAQMGHWKASDTLHRHYRALRTRAEARAFWELRP